MNTKSKVNESVHICKAMVLLLKGICIVIGDIFHNVKRTLKSFLYQHYVIQIISENSNYIHVPNYC